MKELSDTRRRDERSSPKDTDAETSQLRVEGGAIWVASGLVLVFVVFVVWMGARVAADRAALRHQVTSMMQAHHAIAQVGENAAEDAPAWETIAALRSRVPSENPELRAPLDRALELKAQAADRATAGLVVQELEKFVLAGRSRLSRDNELLDSHWDVFYWILLLALVQSGLLLGLLRRHREQLGQETRWHEAMGLVEDKTREAQALGEEYSRAKARFLADISHEFRTPMNGVVGMTELLLKDLHATAQQRGHLETLQGSAKALTSILDDLLDLSKLEAGVLELTCEPFDLHGLVRQRVTVNRAAARAKGLQYGCVIDDDVPRFLRGDALRLGQVLGNLVDNAVKFTSAGEVHVRVSRAWDGIRFEVRDTGPGLPRESAEHLFEPFARLDGNRQHMGSGLGLTLCRQVVQWMGGDLGVESLPGHGSTFWFELDLGEGEPTVTAPIPDLQEESSYEGVRVLVVDDHPINRRVVCAILERLGVACDAVVDGSDAVEAVREGEYDLVLMDIEMPRMNGVDATKAIRRQADPIPIIALTAHAMASTRRACFQAGMDDFLAKPVSIQQLDKALGRWTAGPHRLPAGAA